MWVFYFELWSASVAHARARNKHNKFFENVHVKHEWYSGWYKYIWHFTITFCRASIGWNIKMIFISRSVSPSLLFFFFFFSSGVYIIPIRWQNEMHFIKSTIEYRKSIASTQCKRKWIYIFFFFLTKMHFRYNFGAIYVHSLLQLINNNNNRLVNTIFSLTDIQTWPIPLAHRNKPKFVE